jgi:peptidoglycan/xylan/chitin deacetylase (PgdA/CDA1 family)
VTTVCLTFDFDAFTIWMSTFKQTTPTGLSRGEYGGRVGIIRILDLLRKNDVPATFFVPAHTAVSFSEATGRMVAEGHEIASHGLLHETPVGLPPDEEERLLLQSREVLERISGTRPLGYRSPAWDLSASSIRLLEKHGYLYDSSMMGDDFRPYRARCNDRIDDSGFRPGEATSIIEFPVAWELDDYPYFHFSSRPLNQGLRRPAEVFACWSEEFDYCHEMISDGIFTLTCHPEIIGRGPRIQMLDRLIGHMKDRQARFSTLGAEARRRCEKGLL